MTPQLRLNNGVEMPALGFGVFQTPPKEKLLADGKVRAIAVSCAAAR